MKKIFLIWQFVNLLMCQLHAQTISSKVIASGGGFQSNTTGSLSFTIGETNTQTLSSSTNILTQGFQQSFTLNLNVKAFIEGYYMSASLMQPVLYNEGVLSILGNECDSIEVQLREANSPNNISFSSNGLIHTDGHIILNGIGIQGHSYYIVLKHRNSIETWSANPITISEITNYDFTTSSNKAYGDNQSEVESGVWAMYSGDINQDENIDLIDASLLEADINNFEFGYFTTDINGDGNVDLLDVPIVENNTNAFVYSAHP